MSGMNTRYLGDGVTASFDGYHVWLETPEGNRIALDPHVMADLIAYERDLWVAPQAEAEPPA